VFVSDRMALREPAPVDRVPVGGVEVGEDELAAVVVEAAVRAGGADVGNTDDGLLAAADAVPVSVADWGPVQRTDKWSRTSSRSSENAL
jgi:hypothetical protein